MPQQLNKKLIPYKAIEVENADEILSILCNAFPSCSFERPVGMKCLPRNKKDSNTLKEEAQRIADLFFFRPELVTRSLSGSVEIPKDEAMERLQKQVDLVKDENITTLSQLPWDSLTARFRKLIRRDDTPTSNLFTQAEVKVESENGIYYVYFSFTPRKQEHCPLTALMTSCIAIEKDQNMGLRVSCSALSGDFAREVVRTVPVWAEKVVTHLCYYLDSGKRADVNMPIRQVPISRYFGNLLRVREHPVVKDLSKVWNNYEKTDKSKHLFEDVGIVAYLATLFESLDMKHVNFVDIGCGNGVNTYLLNTLFGDHIKGIGYDLQQRRIWSYYEEQGQRDMLHLQPITPNWPQLEQPFPPETNFLVGVHTDELTPWIPLFAMIRHCNFFILPCCPYDFYGKFRRSGNEPFDSDWPYLDHIVNISRNLGFNVRVDNLKIPSQKKTCVIGTVPEDGQLLIDKNKYWEMVMDQMLTPSLKANGCRGFTVRPKVDQSRNVTNLPRDTRDIINEAVVKVLLDHDSEGCFIADLADQLPIDIIKELKRQNGGLQTFIKINKAGYIVFLYMEKLNESRYKVSITTRIAYTLSERFQLSENMRSAKLLRGALCCITICNMCTFTCYALFWVNTDPTLKIFFKLLYRASVSIYCFALVAVSLRSCDIWKDTFLQILRIKKRRVRSADVPFHITCERVKTIKGRPMIFSLEQEADMYFKQFQSAW